MGIRLSLFIVSAWVLASTSANASVSPAILTLSDSGVTLTLEDEQLLLVGDPRHQKKRVIEEEDQPDPPPKLAPPRTPRPSNGFGPNPCHGKNPPSYCTNTKK
jgi:hypothetical protein